MKTMHTNLENKSQLQIRDLDIFEELGDTQAKTVVGGGSEPFILEANYKLGDWEGEARIEIDPEEVIAFVEGL